MRYVPLCKIENGEFIKKESPNEGTETAALISRFRSFSSSDKKRIPE